MRSWRDRASKTVAKNSNTVHRNFGSSAWRHWHRLDASKRGKHHLLPGISTNEGLVLASDSRTNAGFDQVNTCRKMFQFVQPGECVFVILTSGSLSISQSVISLLRHDFDSGNGLARASSLYDAARIVGDCVRRVSDIDRASLERDSYTFNVHLLLGGQVRGKPPIFISFIRRAIP